MFSLCVSPFSPDVLSVCLSIFAGCSLRVSLHFRRMFSPCVSPFSPDVLSVCLSIFTGCSLRVSLHFHRMFSPCVSPFSPDVLSQYELQLLGVHICGRSALLGEEASLCLIQNAFFDHQPAADLSTDNHKDGGEAPALQRNNIQKQPPTTC
ncbi:unnamed protein product [Acanthosepion pharaonis]|uniref:Uncharacterized protein n=1 Tax=Acanthosepion pharaonis TaxID=158019 RepID=A0A812BBY4_ACAPH|nr:unnamed protein product [Sepia pharaonis]